MNTIAKKIIFVIAFVLVTLVLPSVLLLLFVDATTKLSTYVVIFAVIIFAIFGYVVVSVREMNKRLASALDEIKMQNAAIAYKLSNNGGEAGDTTDIVQNDVEDKTQENSLNIPLNPEAPLVVTKKVQKQQKISDDGFDDFK
ncbi:MAG: hypothetical protein ACI4VW_00090 [Acutalibacteraceae bacterium]